MVVKVKQQQSFTEKFSKSALIAKIAMSLMIFIIIVILGYFFDTVKQQNTITKLKTQKITLSTQLAGLKTALKKQQLVTHNLATLEMFLSKLTKGAPTKLEQSKVLKQLHDIGAKQQIQFNYIKPKSLKTNSYYSILPIEMSLNGNYHHIAQFISDISNTDKAFVVTEIMFKHEVRSDNLMSLVLSGDLYTLNNTTKEIKYYPKMLLKNAKGAGPALPGTTKNIKYDKIPMRNPFVKMKKLVHRKYPNVILRTVPLSKIDITGTIVDGAKKWAIIMPTGSKDDKMVHNVSIGDRISQSQALIKSIKSYEIALEKDAGTEDDPKTETVILPVTKPE